MQGSRGLTFERFVAIGDSQTEGVGDPTGPGGAERGWADRFADRLAAGQVRSGPEGTAQTGLLYANLAVRGKLLAQIDEDQMDLCLSMEPDLVSLVGGLNDVLRPGRRIDLILARMDTMQARLAASGATVLTVTYPDPALMMPVGKLLSETMAEFNRGLRRIAERHGTLILDIEALADVADPGHWCPDRLHLNPAGHQVLADGMFSLIEPLPDGQPWPGTLPERPRPAFTEQMLAEVRWAGAFLAPWIYRRLAGKSSGDGRHAKRPELTPVEV
ncbi:MAG: SGNH/GDSL hydrolase family protein [Solirubrobacterales bacterium]|nr:SGNH/GDSL hydrolase family protein [Solirubrobacterales bacterium]HMT04046.1 SGNH/GDSL hydrolase family protein [Solirubrobacterales bacterium]